MKKKNKSELIRVKNFSNYFKKVPNSTNSHAGSTANICLIVDRVLYAANVGNTKTILCDQNYNIDNLYKEHTPKEKYEKYRLQRQKCKFPTPPTFIEKLTLLFIGKIVDNKIHGQLQISRCFGSFDFKREVNKYGEKIKPTVKVQPFVKVVPLKNNHEFIIIGTAGVFDMMNYIDLAFYVKEHMVKGDEHKGLVLETLFD
jgi:serine/threonine protein phosphatase PrpC